MLPDSWLESCFCDIPEVVIFLGLSITPNIKHRSVKPPSFVANLNYNPKSQTFEHNIIDPFEKTWCESRKMYWENYRFILPLDDVVEIYSQKHEKGRKKLRYYVVCDQDNYKNGIRRISKRKAYKMAIIRADIVRILSY